MRLEGPKVATTRLREAQRAALQSALEAKTAEQAELKTLRLSTNVERKVQNQTAEAVKLICGTAGATLIE